MNPDPNTLPSEPALVYRVAYNNALAASLTPEQAREEAWIAVHRKWDFVGGKWVEHELTPPVRQDVVAELESPIYAYDPDQPRAPAGQPDGGQWIGEGGGGESGGSSQNKTSKVDKVAMHRKVVQRALNDSKGRQELRGRVTTILDKYGVPSDKVDIVEGFIGLKWDADTLAKVRTGINDMQISLTNLLAAEREGTATVEGLIAHEAEHMKLNSVIDESKAELTALKAGEYIKSDSDFLAMEGRENFPASNALLPFDAKSWDLANSGSEISAYADQYWRKVDVPPRPNWEPEPWEPDSWRRYGNPVNAAFHETLAEISKLIANGEPLTAIPEGWVDLHSAVAKAYKGPVKHPLEGFLNKRVVAELESPIYAYDPDQPRAPAGQPDGGQWVGEGGAGGGAGKPFDAAEWKSLGFKQAREKWKSLSRGEKDAYANARTTIKEYVGKLTKGREAPATGNAHTDIGERVKQFADILPEEASAHLEEAMRNSYDNLVAAGASPEDARGLALDMTDTIAAQDYEAAGRSLGDHGVHHLVQDINLSKEFLALLPDNINTPENQAMMDIAGAYHDTGYLTPPAQAFLDADHPRWSAQYYQEHIAPQVSKVFGKDFSDLTATVIATHSQTDIDWENEPETSAFSTADNLALFHAEKLPAVFRYVPNNIPVLLDLALGEVDVSTAKVLMKDNISKSDVSPAIKQKMVGAIEELTPNLPEYTLGMLGARLEDVHWEVDHPVVTVVAGKHNAGISKVLDLGQKQFAKMADTFGQSPKEFMDTGKFNFKNRAGKTLLEGRLRKVISDFIASMWAYAPDQPRAPAGQPDGGQWVSEGGGGGDGGSGSHSAGAKLVAPEVILNLLEKTTKDKAGQSKMRKRVTQLAKDYGIPKDKLVLMSKTLPGLANAASDGNTDEVIVSIPTMMAAEEIGSKPEGIIAHEAEHTKFNNVIRDLIVDQRTMSAIEGVETEEDFNKLSEAVKKSYPTAQKLLPFDNRSYEMAKSDGVTEYSKSYWPPGKLPIPKDEWNSGAFRYLWRQPNSHLFTATHETLAEISMLKATKQSIKHVAKVWLDLHEAVNSVYKGPIK